MVILKKGHHYVNKNKKSKYINDIIPHTDLHVPNVMAADFEDVTKKGRYGEDKGTEQEIGGDVTGV